MRALRGATVETERPAAEGHERSMSSSLRELWSGSARLLLALSLLNVSNYLFHVVVSRFLGPVRYGALAALLAIVLVLSVPLSVLQTVVAKRIASLRAEGRSGETRSLAASTARALYPGAVVAAIVLLVATPATAALLHVEGVSAAMLAPYLLLSLLAAVPLGVLQGELRFSALATAVVVGVVVRLGAGIGLVWAGLGVTGAMLATVLAQGAGLAVAAWLVGMRRDEWRSSRASLGLLRGEVWVALLSLGSFWLLVEADLALARHYLEPHAAGLYSSAGLIARAVLFLPAAVGIVAFPRFAERAGRGPEARRWLRGALGIVAGIVALALPFLVALRGQIIGFTFGDEFRDASGLLPVLAAAMGFMALTSILVYFHVAAGSRAYRIVMAGAIVETILIALFHRTPEQIAFIVMGVAAVVAALLYHAASAISRWSPPVDAGAESDLVASLAGEPSVELSLVMPCHNAGPGLAHVLSAIERELDAVPSWEVIVVSDGSTDETVRVAEAAGDGVRVLQYPRRIGKGNALRVGLWEARGRYIGFIDADGDITPDAIRPFLEIMRLYEPDIVLGSKRHPLSEVEYPLARRMMSWTYHKLVRLLFRVNVRDTQTGLKLVRRETLAAVLPLMLEKRYAFDLEMLVVARGLGYRRVFEAPVRIDFQFSGNVNLRAAFRILLDTAAIFYRRYALGSYRPRPVLQDTVPTVNESAKRNGRRKKLPGDRLRILIINWRDLRNPEAGGAEFGFTYEVPKRWVAEGHHVTILTSLFSAARRSEVIEGISIRRLGRLRSGSFHLRVQRELSRRAAEYDVIIDEVNTLPFFTPLRRRNLPPIMALIHQLAGDVLDAHLPRPLAAAGRWIEPRILRLYRDVPTVTVSESTRKDLLEIGLSNVHVVYSGRDEAPPIDVNKEAVPTFMFAGRLVSNKRPSHALEAFCEIRRSLPEARLWIAGQGPLQREIATKLPNGAQMLGYLDRDELYRRMARSHCLLFPSVREGWGLVVIEANSVGTPVAGYDVPGIRDSIRHGRTGLLAAAGDPTDLARQAVSLVCGDGYPQICAQAMEWAKTFSWDRAARELMGIIRDEVLIDGGGRISQHRVQGPRAIDSGSDWANANA